MTSAVTTVQVATAHRLRSLTVHGGFLDGQTFTFADGLNCIIGGKGTGKSTLLEFVRFTLDAMPDKDLNPTARKRVESLVQGNLGTGTLELTIETKEGVSYTVTRKWNEAPLVLGPDGEATSINVKGLFPSDIYSVDEIGLIADNPLSQLALIDKFEADEVRGITSRITNLQDQLRANASAVIPLEEQLAKLRDELKSETDVIDRLKALASAREKI